MENVFKILKMLSKYCKIFLLINCHYINNGSSVYACLLDAYIAFDRVHYGKLFDILLSKDIPKCIVRLIFDSYLTQKTRVIWNSVKS